MKRFLKKILSKIKTKEKIYKSSGIKIDGRYKPKYVSTYAEFKWNKCSSLKTKIVRLG